MREISASEWLCGGFKALLKMAAALPGDVVTLSERGVRVNRRPILPQSRPQEHSADTPPHAIAHIRYGTDRVPPGAVWLYGPHW